VKIADLA